MRRLIRRSIKKAAVYSEENDDIFREMLMELEKNADIRKLRQYPQHGSNDSFQHSHNVAVYSFYLAKKWRWKIVLEDLVMGAMLHDYYLYDIKEKGISDYEHGSRHPGIALENAKKCFEVNKKVENIIVSHMWPLPFTKMPKSREAILVNLADKYCAVQEMHRGMHRIEEKIGEREERRYSH